MIESCSDYVIVISVKVTNQEQSDVVLGGDVVSTIGVDLQGHVNTVFALSDNPVVLDIDNVTIPGVFIACMIS
jgi:hypothetical protein